MDPTIVVAGITCVSTILSAVILQRQKEDRADREDDRKRTAILIKSTKACLNGLHQLGANGPVTKAMEELEEYTNEKASN